MVTRVCLLFVAALNVISCASPQAERTRLQGLTACCNEIQTIPISQPLNLESEISISQDAPVFDFESGRSHFVAFTIPERYRGRKVFVRSFASMLPQRGRAFGYFAPTLMYLDAERKVIASTHDDKPMGELYGWSGHGAFVSTTSVPRSAHYVIVYTSSERLGERYTTYIQSPTYLAPVGGALIPQGGRQSPHSGVRTATGTAMFFESKAE